MIDLNDDYLLVHPSIRSISVFDSIIYDFNDIEILSPAQRNYLIEQAMKRGFHQTSGKYLSHHEHGRIFFPSQRMFNRNFRSFLPDKREDDIWLALTPTQAAFLMLESRNCDSDDLNQLMMKHPFNLKVLDMVTTHESFHSAYVSMRPELGRLFERAQVMLKNKKPLS